MILNFCQSRKALSLTQSEVAKLLKRSYKTISGWENNYDNIPLKLLLNYANYFNLSLDYLYGLTDKDLKYTKFNLNLKVLGIKLRILRKNNYLSEEQVATLINTNQSVISRYENSQVLISTTFLYSLSKLYNFSIDELFDREIITEKED